METFNMKHYPKTAIVLMRSMLFCITSRFSFCIHTNTEEPMMKIHPDKRRHFFKTTFFSSDLFLYFSVEMNPLTKDRPCFKAIFAGFLSWSHCLIFRLVSLSSSKRDSIVHEFTQPVLFHFMCSQHIIAWMGLLTLQPDFRIQISFRNQ